MDRVGTQELGHPAIVEWEHRDTQVSERVGTLDRVGIRVLAPRGIVGPQVIAVSQDILESGRLDIRGNLGTAASEHLDIVVNPDILDKVGTLELQDIQVSGHPGTVVNQDIQVLVQADTLDRVDTLE